MTHISACIDFSSPQGGAAPRLRHVFGTPRAVLVAHELAEVRAVLDAVQAAAENGSWCVGYLRYEAAPAFDAALAVHAPDGPLAWFAVHDDALPWVEDASAATARVQWLDTCPRPAFGAAMDQIQRAIAAGELYQVNFTAPLLGEWAGEPEAGAAQALFAALQRAQPGGYAAFIDTGNTGDGQLLSVSPELFFDWQDGQILARPMKGTAARGATPEMDAAQAAALRASPKERAENVMIVDLLRNDLSRIAEPFSVQVPALFHTEALPTVWQMTSDVRARTRAGTTLADVFAALFPCGSVTGAPKVRAMQMIRKLEAGPRGVYCGAIGVVRPGKDGHGIRATFNVPIRTVSVQAGGLRCGIGSGITSGAVPDAEWQEWRNKRQFLERASMPFDLLETLALKDGQLRHAAEHLQRLAGAAAHFGIPWDAAAVRHCLHELAQAHPQDLWRVRLLLDARGRARAEAFAMDPSPAQVRLRLAERPLEDAHGEFVRFKTTRRAHYDAFTPTESGVFDTVLWNTEGEITECTRGNVAMLLDGRWVTPPLACGLLPGVGRALALREGRLTEAVVRLEDLPRVQGWAFVNSLRGWLAAEKV
ncbi:aminodeoxychorismate synthase component I [Polaromonas naphthalenivorans]|uniref:Para-aminobenzoate synthase, subunit I n=1 Tax=Polaromonas naphthalenivorans (strain CJ2) TaxID=365044 RepID=A1VKS8_POLNA|nr:aminodeoxychorismate synthase component I [Polaromonas naphthalenivorans]ABM36256.1 para-aminobenzoate synthase, subunit I [Polaromonas naphthalenivorans CJ2]